MSRIQLALDVDDLEQAVAFYTTLLGVAPAKRRPGYANFAVADPALKLVLLENPGRGGRLNHLGIEVDDTATVHAEITRLSAEGLITDEELGTTCCYASQDKVWVTGPDAERWEVYTVLGDSPTFGTAPQALEIAPASPAEGPCCSADADQQPAAAPGEQSACC